MLALIENEIVGPGWITEQIFTDIVAISQMTPGPIGINSATYIGYVVPGQCDSSLGSPIWGILGSVICTITVMLPSFILVAYTSHFIRKHHESAYVKGVFMGLRPVVVGLIASAALLLMNEANFGAETYEIACSIGICAVAFCMAFFWKVHPILIVCLAGLAGFLLF